MKINEVNILVLAYMGDSIYETHIRQYLIGKKINKVNDLQKAAINYVSARAQSKYLEIMINENLFSEEEIDVIKRARNNKGCSHPKNTDILTYKHATGLEALIGYLYLTNNMDRITLIMNYIIELSEER